MRLAFLLFGYSALGFGADQENDCRDVDPDQENDEVGESAADLENSDWTGHGLKKIGAHRPKDFAGSRRHAV